MTDESPTLTIEELRRILRFRVVPLLLLGAVAYGVPWFLAYGDSFDHRATGILVMVVQLFFIVATAFPSETRDLSDIHLWMGFWMSLIAILFAWYPDSTNDWLLVAGAIVGGACFMVAGWMQNIASLKLKAPLEEQYFEARETLTRFYSLSEKEYDRISKELDTEDKESRKNKPGKPSENTEASDD